MKLAPFGFLLAMSPVFACPPGTEPRSPTESVPDGVSVVLCVAPGDWAGNVQVQYQPSTPPEFWGLFSDMADLLLIGR